MFSIFPPLLSFSGLSPLLLRLTLGLVMLFWAFNKFKAHKTGGITAVSIIEALVGISLFVGFMTQVAAFISAIILGIRLVKKIRNRAFFTDGVNYYFILFVIAISLIFTGAGFIAFDLPL